MESRIEKALIKKQQGYNCAQSVVCTYCDLFDVDESTAFMISEGFGGGIGGMRLTCGALTGLFMLLGLKNNNTNPARLVAKAHTLKLVKEAAMKFKEKNGSISCAELKGIETGKILRTCPECIADACKIFEDCINAEQALNISNIASTKV